jgi:hypothetical protein
MKEQYILMRKQKQFDYQLLYNYYISKGGDIDPNTFMRIIDTARRLDILSGLDVEFGLISLHDNQGNEILVINYK